MPCQHTFVGCIGVAVVEARHRRKVEAHAAVRAEWLAAELVLYAGVRAVLVGGTAGAAGLRSTRVAHSVIVGGGTCLWCGFQKPHGRRAARLGESGVTQLQFIQARPDGSHSATPVNARGIALPCRSLWGGEGTWRALRSWPHNHSSALQGLQKERVSVRKGTFRL